MKTDTPYICLICQKPVPDYKPQYCCSGHDCGCMGSPTEPCVCSLECDKALSSNGTIEQRRINAGIALWSDTPPQPAHGELKSAHDQIPREHKSVIQNLLYHPEFLARLLLEESEGAEGWAKAHAGGTSVTEEGGKWIPKRDAYTQKAKRFRDAAHSLNPDLSVVEVHSKETMDYIREQLEELTMADFTPNNCANIHVAQARIRSFGRDLLAKLNPPQG